MNTPNTERHRWDVVRNPQDGRRPSEYKPDWPAEDGHYWNCTIFGDWVQTQNDTPFSCNPAFETYWSM